MNLVSVPGRHTDSGIGSLALLRLGSPTRTVAAVFLKARLDLAIAAPANTLSLSLSHASPTA